jgi:hypothetical protein
VPVTVTPVALAAATVKVEELPDVIEVGLATMLTVGADGPDAGVTVTVAVAVALPPAPIAVAVYVVFAIGLTIWVPPLACSV